MLAGALAVTLIGVGVIYRLRSRRQGPPVTTPQSLPSNVDQQVLGYTFTRSDNNRQVFTIRAARTVALKEGGTTVLQDVVVEVFGRKGDRHDVLRTERAEYNSLTGNFLSPGTTQIQVNAPPDVLPGAENLRGPQTVDLETSGVTYRQKGSELASDQPVRFKAGAISGSATGLVYATRDDWLELRKDVRGEWREPRQPPVQLKAAHLRYDKDTGRIALAGPLEFTRGTSRVTAGSGMVTLDSRNRLTQAVLEKAVQGSIQSGQVSRITSIAAQADRLRGDFDPATGALKSMTADGGVKAESRRRAGADPSERVSRLEAQAVVVAFQGVHARPEKGSATGDVRLTVLPVASGRGGTSSPVTSGATTTSPPEKASPKPPLGALPSTKVLTAGQVDFTFRSDGRSLVEANTVGEGKLTLVPEDSKQGERELTAGQLFMRFDAKDRIESLAGTSGTRLVQQPPLGSPPGPGKRESASERLSATFDTATEDVLGFQQSGKFTFRGDDRQASADQADYSPEGQILTLTGHPEVWDATTRLKAERLLLHLETDTAEGIGKVEATSTGAAGAMTVPGSKPPAVTAQSASGAASNTVDSTNVLADRVEAGRHDQVVHYEGHVRAWHGVDVIEAPALDYYGKQRRLSAGSPVLTSHLAASSRPAGSAPAPASKTEPAAAAADLAAHPLTIRADHVDYFEEGRKADYHGNVELRTEATTLRSDRMSVYFSPASAGGGSQVDRVVADGHVQVTQPQRRASGDHADYLASTGKIVMRGGPPSLYDEDKGFTTGQSLTFFIHDDTLAVDGGEKSPTLSKRRVSQ
ncbi:MAG TPA: LptA/OstA family protein [Terriglobia bacterium]|nr:LptA/OstA family protein [Terriglobia bacterium]